jgi:lipopolysaccharide/colanic/teichoic acid biosynthesis glycosyltransferase
MSVEPLLNDPCDNTPMSTHSSDLWLLLGPNAPEASSFQGRTASRPRAQALAAQSAVKRAMDLVGAIGGLFFLSPLLLIVGLLVRWESRGPILFRQLRTGRNGKTFRCLKFRTMVPDAEKRLRDLEARNESVGGVLFKIKDDPRVTPLGRILRRTSLDELPQLWNILKGEMSLVGPRPLQLRDCERLAEQDPEAYSRRLEVLPGLTGPWQVGGRSELDYSRMLELDLHYVENWSIATDMEILFKTVGVVLEGKGAS